MSDKKVSIMYFYSDRYDNEKSLAKICKKLRRIRSDIQVSLVNIDDPINEKITELYSVNMVPLMVFFTSKGDVAAKRFIHLSAEEVVHDIADKIGRGELPNPEVEEVRSRILKSLESVTKRNEVSELVGEQIQSDLEEISTESEIRELVNSHISAINHSINDLQEFKRVLKKFSIKQNSFVV